MSRVQENEKVLNNIKTRYTGSTEQVMCLIETNKLGILSDISRSLAIIADALVEGNKLEADISKSLAIIADALVESNKLESEKGKIDDN